MSLLLVLAHTANKSRWRNLPLPRRSSAEISSMRRTPLTKTSASWVRLGTVTRDRGYSNSIRIMWDESPDVRHKKRDLLMCWVFVATAILFCQETSWTVQKVGGDQKCTEAGHHWIDSVVVSGWEGYCRQLSFGSLDSNCL